MAERFDLVLRGGEVVTPDGVVRQEIGIREMKIAAIGEGLEAREYLDTSGRVVVPGGIESHCHIEQESSLGGVMTADDFRVATKAAAFGGNTTVIPFAIQRRGKSLADAVERYRALAEVKAHIDYTFHLAVTDPTDSLLRCELPDLIRSGYRSVKLYMAYDAMIVDDRQMLEVMDVARGAGALVIVHAENWGMIQWETAKLVGAGKTDPRFHPASHPVTSEVEAIQRVAALAKLAGVPVLVLHISSGEGIEAVLAAQRGGAPIYAETCTQYLYLTAAEMETPGPEAAKLCCSPPLRDVAAQEALWRSLADGTVDVVSSDHCPYRYDETGKLSRSAEPAFTEVPNGLPGLEVRLPLLFDGVSAGRITLEDFVNLSSTNAARLYGLYPRKGAIQVGADADLCVWDPERRVRIGNEMLHEDAGYTPFEGREVIGWPVAVVSRGRVVVRDGQFDAEPGSGRLLLVGPPELPQPGLGAAPAAGVA
jgi:dihydropyrimidinase